MKKSVLLIPILLILIICSVDCFDLQKGQDTIDLPIVAIQGTDAKINAKLYKNDFNFNYDVLPQLVSYEDNCVLQISLANNFDSSVQLAEDYYTFNDNKGLCEKGLHVLTKDVNGIATFTIRRRTSDRDEEGIYFLKNKQGTFVFRIVLPLNEQN